MEKLIAEIFDSFRFYFNTVAVFFRGKSGFYFKMFVEKNSSRKYLLLIYSLGFFYLIGHNLIDEYLISRNFIGKVFTGFVENALSNDIYRSLFKRIILLIVVLEILSFLFGRDIKERKILVTFNYLVLSWLVILITFTILLVAVASTLSKWISIPEWVRTIGTLIFTLFILGSYFEGPYEAIKLCVKRGLLNRNIKIKGGVFLFLIPVVFFFSAKGILSSTKENDRFSIGAVPNHINIVVDSIQNDRYFLHTALIFTNRQETDYFIDPRQQSYKLSWAFFSPANTSEVISDSTKMIINESIAILPRNTPTLIDLTVVLSSFQYNQLVHLGKSHDNQEVMLVCKTLNAGDIILSADSLQLSQGPH